MKSIKFILGLLFFSLAHSLSAQTIRFDKAAGDVAVCKFGNRMMAYLETGQMETFLSARGADPIDVEQLKEGILLLNEQVAILEGAAPPLFQDKSAKQSYYERNFYDEGSNKIVLQIRLELYQLEGQNAVRSIVFRQGADVSKRTFE
ncbi:MAG: hypothetical protein EOP49_32200, partial [Sphingobacteriales bacterium]